MAAAAAAASAAASLRRSASRVPVSIPAPQEVTVTLVDVQPDVWWVWDVDGTVWLLPAYRFIGDDGGWYTVPAVTDEFLVRVPVDTRPAVDRAGPAAARDRARRHPAERDRAGRYGCRRDPARVIGRQDVRRVHQADAEALGLTARVVEQDGVSLPVTMDYNPNRVNVAVDRRGRHRDRDRDRQRRLTAIVTQPELQLVRRGVPLGS